jgi:CheY-like chemotaxis protein/HPt (histidine-containing phosphotransfer) domain-containing protein
MDSGDENMDQMKFSGHVLVAEDVQTNQMLAHALLKRMGLDVTIAADGNEAVQKAREGHFDLIFMDIQMPGIDGYQATQRLKEEGVRAPIIALTAHAMKGDDQKCLEAGCDDYLPKPIDRRTLLEKIRKYLPAQSRRLTEKAGSVKSPMEQTAKLGCGRTPGASGSRQTPPSRDSKGILNWEELIGRLGDEELIREVVPIFLNDNRERVEKLTEAVRAGDSKAVKLYAHAVKGAGRNIGAPQLSQVAHRLECAGGQENVEAATSLFDELKAEFEKVVAFLSLEDWMEIAKHEKVVTDDKLHAGIACRCSS